MRLTNFSDYALRVLLYAAAREGALITIEETARVYGISRAHLMKVVNQLTRAGYLTAVRGRSGGLELAKRPERIGLGDVVRADAQSAAPRQGGGWTVALGDACELKAKALVVAHGNQAPDTPDVAEGISDRLFVNDPWSDEGRRAIERAAACDSEVLLIGTGLTMIDVVLSLDEAGHRGRICALSRREVTTE